MSVPATGYPVATGQPATPLEPVLTFVRPGPSAFAWLVSVARDLKGGDPFKPVTVIVPSNFVGQLVSWHLARTGGYVNVRPLRLIQLETEVARPTRPPSQGFLDPMLEASAVRAVLRGCRDRFGGIDHPSFRQALLDLFRELRRTGVDLTGSRAATRSTTTRAALDAYRLFQDRTRDYDDPTRRAERATRRLLAARTMPADLGALGATVLFLPTRLDPHDLGFLAALARWVPLWTALADLADPSGPGDGPDEALADQLASALQVERPRRQAEGQGLLSRTDLRVIRAPDPAEEVREVIRCIAADLERGVPLHRTAILYRQNDPYAALVREALDLAGLPWSSSEGKRLAESRPGRSLLGLLHLPDRDFAREAVMEWLESEPFLEGAVAAIPAASWDRLTRLAGVVRGTEQWTTRLDRHAAALGREADGREREGESAVSFEAARRRADAARTIAAFIADLDTALGPPADGARWADFVVWARALRDRFVGAVDCWTGDERENALAVDAALGRLGDADRIDSTTGPSAVEFIAALEAILYSDRRPTGRFGQGILIEPIAAVAGLAFDRVYLLGMREGAFPPPPPIDPFFPVEAEDPLGRRARQHAEERRDFLMAVATADDGQLTLCVPDSDGTRAAFPSRWLLELASARAEVDLDATRFAALDSSAYPWLRVVYSARHGVARDLPPADLEDRRLRQAVSWVEQGPGLDRHPMAGREDLPLGRALRLADARHSNRLTPWDGNLSSLAGESRRLSSIFDGRRAFSASAVQTWATCGFRYFLERVIGVEPTERPAESWTVDRLDRGALIHLVLDQFFTCLRESGRPRPDEKYTSTDAALIDHLAREQFAEIEGRGATGHALAWEIARSVLLFDLRAFLAADQEWRRETGLTPVQLEQDFGSASDGGWPALVVEVPVGAATRSIRFRGKIDRIDGDPTGQHAYLFDYKTGSASSPTVFQEDPVVAGRKVQLALYSRAVRNNLPGLAGVGSALWFVSVEGKFKRSALPDDLAFVDRRLDEVIGLIARGIASGAFPQVAGKRDTSNGFENCRYCAFDRICPARRDQTWWRKREDPVAAIHRQLEMTPESGDAS